jgi:hypothetical protein
VLAGLLGLALGALLAAARQALGGAFGMLGTGPAVEERVAGEPETSGRRPAVSASRPSGG